MKKNRSNFMLISVPLQHILSSEMNITDLVTVQPWYLLKLINETVNSMLASTVNITVIKLQASVSEILQTMINVNQP